MKPKAKQEEKKEGNRYDKIIKENLEQIFLPIIEQTLGIEIKTFRPWKEKMQTTLEREYDCFYEVSTKAGEEFILHLEFQTESVHQPPKV